jgi:hypothetical protein
MDAEFRVYDAMMAVAKAGWSKAKQAGQWPDGRPWKESDPLICYARVYTLANMTDRSIEQVDEAIGKLEGKTWAICTTQKQRRKWGGKFTTYEYQMLTHEDYVAAHPDDCPELRYNPETGDKLKPGRLAKGLERRWVRKMAGFALPDSWADAVADAIASKKAGTATGNPVAVAEYPEINRETILAMRAAAASGTGRGDPVAASAGNPVTVDTGNPVTDGQRKSCDKSVVIQPEDSAVGSSQEAGGQTSHLDSQTKTMNDETVGQHFGLPFPVTIREVAPGLNTDTEHWAAFGCENESRLQSICWEVTKELSGQPYLGPATHALIMDMAMKRFNTIHGNVPKAWLKVMHDLRRAQP